MPVNEQRIWTLLAKRKSGEASADELEELRALLEENESVLFSEDILDKLWDAPLRANTGAQSSAHWSKIEAAIQVKKRKRKQLKWWLSAAAILILLGLSFYFNQGPQKNNVVQEKLSGLNNIATPADTRLKIELPDGSTVWINEDSRLTYNSKTFGTSEREVFLQGEAYFEVRPNAKLPFSVHADQMNITVLGTSFNVKAYKKDKTMEATLISGQIAVTINNNPRKEIMLRPEEKIIISKVRPQKIKQIINEPISYKVIKVEKDEAGLVKATDWMRHRRLVFDNASFETIASRMEKWYGIPIRFAEDSLKHLHFSGIIEDETLSEALTALQLSQHFNFYQTDSIVWIGKNNHP